MFVYLSTAVLQCGVQYLRENGMRVTDRQTGKEGGITLHGRQYQPVQHVTPDGIFSSIQKVLKGKGKVIPLQARCGPEGGRGIALLFHDRDTRRGWVVSSTPRPHFTAGKDSVPILQEAGWAPGPVWTGGKSRPHRDSIPFCQSVTIPTELPGTQIV